MKFYDREPSDQPTSTFTASPLTDDPASVRDPAAVNGAAKPFVSSDGSEQSSTSRSAEFLAEERKVKDALLMKKDLQPCHTPEPDPDGHLEDAQLAGAQLLSNALVRSFLRNRYSLGSLTTLPLCIAQWCDEHQESFVNFTRLSTNGLTLSWEWAYDRSISRILFDHDYVRKLPLEPFDPNALQRYLQATMRNDKRNVAKLGDEKSQHDNDHGDDGDWEPLTCRYAAPLTQADRGRLFKETLDEMCDVLNLDEQTAEILFQYYHCGVSRDDIEATYGIAIESVRRRMKRAVETSTEDGVMAEASLQQLITELHRSDEVMPIKIVRQEDTGSEDENESLYTALESWRWKSLSSDDLI